MFISIASLSTITCQHLSIIDGNLEAIYQHIHNIKLGKTCQKICENTAKTLEIARNVKICPLDIRTANYENQKLIMLFVTCK